MQVANRSGSRNARRRARGADEFFRDRRAAERAGNDGTIGRRIRDAREHAAHRRGVRILDRERIDAEDIFDRAQDVVRRVDRVVDEMTLRIRADYEARGAMRVDVVGT